MKTIFLLPVALFFLISCGGEKKEESTISNTTGIKQDTVSPHKAIDSTAYACACEHKCATKDECEKNCGPDCQMAENN